MSDSASELDVAIIGMAGRFPGAKNISVFWENLINGKESITVFSDEELLHAGVDASLLKNPNYVKAASILADEDIFDADFFGYSAREAALIDPQSRLFLECAWEALECAGYVPSNCKGAVGVYASQSMNTYLLQNLYSQLSLDEFILSHQNIQHVLANLNDFLATRVSYKLNLSGPSINVQCACSSSLIAVHMACQSLTTGESDMALAGGVSLYLPQKRGYLYEEGMILSPDGHCRPFDADAKGTLFGRGVGVVVLKSFEAAVRDGDTIYAVIKGSAINNDGASKVGFTAPSVEGQARVIAEALKISGVGAETISYIEAHGTGTTQGDPIEVAALTRVFRNYTDKNGFCGLGTVKSNFGHLDAAAGIAGLIKTALMLHNKKVAPSLHYKSPNPQIDFEHSPFYVCSTQQEWKTSSVPRRAGVSAFGMGGTNAHIILEEAPERRQVQMKTDRPAHILTLSAKNEDSLQRLLDHYASHLEHSASTRTADICFTTNNGRAHFDHRLSVVGTTSKDLHAKLASYSRGTCPAGVYKSPGKITGAPEVVFLCTGQGSQYVGMGRELYETQPVFRKALDMCDELLRGHIEKPLLQVLYPQPGEESPLHETAYTQPALFALEYALYELWHSWGIEPSVVMGHSVGEYVAACIAGAFSLEAGLRLIAERGRLMQSLPAGGEMAAVFAGERRVTAAIGGYRETLSIAAVNGPENIVISGARDSLGRVLEELEAEGVAAQNLVVSHAFHSPLMEPILDAFERAAAQVTYSSPRMGLISNVTGRLANDDEIASARYWRRHVRAPVQFYRSMQTLHEKGEALFVELGPHPVLLGMGRQCVGDGSAQWLPSLRRGGSDWAELLASLAQLYTAGVSVDWVGFDRAYNRTRVPLPTYPFQRKRYWIESPAACGKSSNSVIRGDTQGGDHPLLGRRLYSPLFTDTVYEVLLSVADVPYLCDHKVSGITVFPATAYIEILSAAAEHLFHGGAWRLVELIISDPLIFQENEHRRLQLMIQSESEATRSFRLMSVVQEKGEVSSGWKLHASGALARENAEPQQCLKAHFDPDQLFLGNEEELPATAYYQSLLEMGLSYGPTFRGIKQLWRRQNEVIAMIQAPAGLEIQSSVYHFHPALLDACLQAVLAALPDIATMQGKEMILLPMILRQARIRRTSSSELWCHAELLTGQNENKDMVRVCVSIWDSVGQSVAQIDDLQLKQVNTRAIHRHGQAAHEDWLYEIKWYPKARTEPEDLALEASYLKSPAEIGNQMKDMIVALRKRFGLDSYDQLQPELDSLCAAYVVKSLKAMGLECDVGQQFTLDGLAIQLGVLKQHRCMLRRMLQILKEDGLLAENNGTWTVERRPSLYDTESWLTLLMDRYASCRLELKMTKRCGESLAGVLTGKTDPIALLFPEGSLKDLENLYQEAPFTNAYNFLVQKAVTTALKALPAGRTVKILEVGAGTGGTASFILPFLDPSCSEYFFTDVSPHFMNKAKEKFKKYDFVTYRLLDIESDPEAQGFKPGYFDIILATNVLHATRRLEQTLLQVRHLLKSDGLLVMVEGIVRQRWVDLIFGLTEGWWLFSDENLRSDYPLIDLAKWNSVLKNTGFDEITTLPEHSSQNQMLFNQGIIVARASFAKLPPVTRSKESNIPSPRKWLLLADDTSIAKGLQQRFRSRGDSCDLVLLDSHPSLEKDGMHRVGPAQAGQFGRWIQEIKSGESGEYYGAICLLDGSDGLGEPTSIEELKADLDRRGSSLLHFIQTLIRDTAGAPPRLWVVTSGSQPVGDTSEPAAVAQSILWGISRVVALEHPELKCKCIDLDPESVTESINSLFEEILVDDAETQVGFRGKRRFAARLVRIRNGRGPMGNGPSATAARPYRLAIAERGTIDNLQFLPALRQKPGPGEIEIRVRSSGLNLKDVLNVLGVYPGEAGPLGLECAGEVVRRGKNVTQFQIGDEVVALAAGAFSSFVTVSEQMAVRKPMFLSFAETASLPAAFTTAYYALCHLARMNTKETVLIHSAAGGVGMAALQLAKRCGATVFATAGNAEKRSFVQSLGADYVMDSRSLQFAEEIRKITSGKGVDIVLNSLAGDFITSSLSLLKKNGRFCELGKQGILEPQAFYASKPEASYFIIDLGESLKADAALGRQMLTLILQWVEDGSLTPLPVTQFPIADAKNAFRYMAQAKHVGKVVFTGYEQLSGSLIKTRLDATGTNGTDSLRFNSSASYLLTGGKGGLGLLLARWMVERGARHLILAGRSKPTHEAREVIRDLQNAGAKVYQPELDVSSPSAVAGLFREFGSSMPRLRGIIHAAGVLDDGVFMQLTWNRFKTLFGPKVYGAWNLHQLSQDMDLDFFVMFSSIASVLGSPGQANHAAANAFMDSLAHFRRARGLPAVTINWGAWSQVGAAAKGEVLKRLTAQGIDAIEPEQGLELFEKLLIDAMDPSTEGCGQVGVLHVDWAKYVRQSVVGQPPRFLEFVASSAQSSNETIRYTDQRPDILGRLEGAGPARKLEYLREYIAELIARGLGLEPAQRVDLRRSFSEYGLDSLMAVDLRSRIGSGLKLREPLPVTMFFDYPTLESLSNFIAKEVFRLPGNEPGIENKIESEPSRHLNEIEKLTEEEAEALLLKELSPDSDKQVKG